MAGLKEYREQVTACDQQLMRILKERLEVCAQIGEYKKVNDMPVVQSTRFEELQELWANEAVAYGLDKDFACRMFRMIHDESVRIQNDIKKGER